MVEGGVRIVETITGGGIYGPGFNATIEGGVAAPILVDSGDKTRIQTPYIYAYGIASEDLPFTWRNLESGRVQLRIQD